MSFMTLVLAEIYLEREENYAQEGNYNENIMKILGGKEINK